MNIENATEPACDLCGRDGQLVSIWRCDPDDEFCPLHALTEHGGTHVQCEDYRSCAAAGAAQRAEEDAHRRELQAAREVIDAAEWTGSTEPGSIVAVEGSEPLTVYERPGGAVRRWFDIEPGSANSRRVVRAEYDGSDGAAWATYSGGWNRITWWTAWTAELEFAARVLNACWEEHGRERQVLSVEPEGA